MQVGQGGTALIALAPTCIGSQTHALGWLCCMGGETGRRSVICYNFQQVCFDVISSSPDWISSTMDGSGGSAVGRSPIGGRELVSGDTRYGGAGGGGWRMLWCMTINAGGVLTICFEVLSGSP